MWPAYLAALLLTLPPGPVNGRDGAARSVADQTQTERDAPRTEAHAPNLAMTREEDDEEEGEA
ncbi:hypothetical protein [Roseococcus sp. YIM B11640]|uniref:hypothetical protein n=1 Tax=Roseococcus sp. YIM B11640 TaxID=3133973 RepID=UPI003C7BC61F